MEIQSYNKSFFVSLGSDIDVFRFSQISSSAKFEEVKKPNGFVYFQIESLKGARELCRKFIKEFNLGSSNWIGGRIIDENNNFIAQISYNGRIWNDEDNKKAKEIELC